MNESYDLLFWFFYSGGTVEKISLYDEESVDGWRWTIDDLEVSEFGVHEQAPIMPDQVLEHMKKKYNHYPS